MRPTWLHHNKCDTKGSKSADILFPITHLKCNDQGIFAVGCGSDALVLGALPVKGYLHERVGGQEREKRREREIAVTLHPACIYCTI